jgi:hypothetical protein
MLKKLQKHHEKTA